MKKNIFLTLLVFLSLAITAQEKEASKSDDKSYRPSKRNFTVGIQMGSGNNLSSGLSAFNGTNVSGAPTLSPVTTDGASAVNMVGIDARYFVSNNWAITFSGALSYNETPASLNFPAAGSLPAYNAVVQDSRMDFTYSVGALRFFDYKKNSRILPYVGFAVPVSHARRSSYDPTINANGTIAQLGQNHVEAWGISLQAVAGLDYYISDNIFLGASIRPLSVGTVHNTRFPGPGLLSRKIRSFNFSSFVQPSLTLGFKL